MTNFLKKSFTLLLAITIGVSSGVLAQTHDDGMIAMQLEKWDKAIEVYSALTKADPQDQVAWLTMGSAYLAKGDKDKAKATFDAAFNAKSEGPYAMIASGRILLLQNKYAEADAIFKKAKKYGKKDVATRRLIGESFLYEVPGVKPNFTRAEAELKEAMDFASKDFATLMSLGYCYKEMPNGGLAAQHYEFAVQVEPQNALAQFMLARVYRAAKIYDKFFLFVDKAIALNPKFSEALRAKTEFLYFDKKWEKATEAAKTLVNQGADVTIDDEMMLANLLYITKDCKGCSDIVERILKKDGSKNYLRRLQAYCNYDNGKYAEGLKILEDFFKQVTPDKVMATDYEYLARLQIANGKDTAIAIQNFLKVIKMDSSRWSLHEEMAKLYYDAKNYCQAAKSYQSYIDSLTDKQALVNANYTLGICHYFCPDDSLHFIKAEKAFTTITELLPEASIGWLWLAKSAKNRDPDVVANPDSVSKFGVAKPFFEKFAELASVDKEKNKNDLIAAYEYLSYYYFSRNEDEPAKATIDKLLELDPENESGVGMKEAIEAGSTPGKPIPPTKPNGGGGKGKK